MVGIVLVSHSHLLAVGLQQLAQQISQNRVTITTAGGVDNETCGTNAERIYQAIQEAYSSDGVLILFDLGSAILSTQIAIEMLTAEQQKSVTICDAPLVEGAVAAAVEASLGHQLHEVDRAAQAARGTNKIL